MMEKKWEFKLNSPNIWLTADLHFSHQNVIKHCPNRAINGVFDINDIKAHDEWLIKKWNNTIKKTDIVYIIGDFCFANREETIKLLGKLNGDKHLILGNHDLQWVKELGWESIDHFKEIKIDGRRVSLSHYPMLTFPGARYGAIQMFGHVHQNWRGTRNSVNVGVDVFDFRPVTLPEVLDRASSLPINAHWEEVEPGVSLNEPSVSRG